MAVVSAAAVFRSPAATAEGEIRRKGSRFLARLDPVADEETAGALLREVERDHRDATHHCWARRLGWPAVARSSDAGEPAGTAGAPILRALEGSKLSDAILVVTRWYGGVKLGRGGLARAYAEASRRAIEAARLVERRPTSRYLLTAPYTSMGAVERVLGAPGLAVERKTFGELVQIELRVDLDRRRAVEEALADLGPAVELERLDSESPSPPIRRSR